MIIDDGIIDPCSSRVCFITKVVSDLGSLGLLVWMVNNKRWSGDVV